MKRFLILAWLLCLQFSAPFAQSQAATLSAGRDFTCTILYGGAYCWGDNTEGQLGANTTDDHRATMVPVAGLQLGVTTISAGGHTACAIQNGAAFCWGSNDNGQLGIGQAGGFSSVPRAVAGLSSGVTDISVGETTVCAIQLGIVYCSGNNDHGQFGNNTIDPSTVPVRGGDSDDVDGTPDALWQRISVGRSHSCGLYGPVGATRWYCWGSNASYQVGQIDQGDSRETELVKGDGPGDVTDISTGATISCAIRLGVTQCMGGGDSYITGQSSDGPQTLVLFPTAVSNVPANIGQPVALSVGADAGRICALNSAGYMNCWGSNNFGGLGSGLASGYAKDQNGADIWNIVPGDRRNSGILFPLYGGVLTSGVNSGVTSGPDHTCFWAGFGLHVYCMGLNTRGQLGNAATANSAVAVPITLALAPPEIFHPPVPQGLIGVPYSYQLTSNQPVTFLANGLPPGLTQHGGVIDGTPTLDGFYFISIQAINESGAQTVLLLPVLTIALPPPVITSPAAAYGTVGQNFAFQAATNEPNVTFSASGLPTGFTMNASGLITATPTQAATFSFTVTATNVYGGSTSGTVVANILPPPVITSAATARAMVATNFSFQLAANEPVTFSATGLPPLFNVNGSVISGSTTGAGTFNVALTATNAAGTKATQTLTITVDPLPLPHFTNGSTATACQGNWFFYQLTTDRPATFTASGLPPGLSVNSAGAIHGVPNANAVADFYNVRIGATNFTGTTFGTLRINMSC